MTLSQNSKLGLTTSHRVSEGPILNSTLRFMTHLISLPVGTIILPDEFKLYTGTLGPHLKVRLSV